MSSGGNYYPSSTGPRHPLHTIYIPRRQPGIFARIFGTVTSSLGPIRRAQAGIDRPNDPPVVIAEDPWGAHNRIERERERDASYTSHDDYESNIETPAASLSQTSGASTILIPTSASAIVEREVLTPLAWKDVNLHKKTRDELLQYISVCNETAVIPAISSECRDLCIQIRRLCAKQMGIIDKYTTACDLAFRNDVNRAILQHNAKEQLVRISTPGSTTPTITTPTPVRHGTISRHTQPIHVNPVLRTRIETEVMQTNLSQESAFMVHTTDGSIVTSMIHIKKLVHQLSIELSKLSQD